MTLDSDKIMLQDSHEKDLNVWKEDIAFKKVAHVVFFEATQF